MDDFVVISEEDYYAKATEFKVWLHEEKNKFFDELTSEQAHEQFKKFVKAWNKFKLDSRSPHSVIVVTI